MPAVFPLELEPLTKSGRYRHMAKRDLAVWERWLDKYAGAFLAVAYDVALGGTKAPAEGLPEGDVLGYQYATALKIDALVIGLEVALVAEVRPHATVSALGAALTYTAVADRDGLLLTPLAPAIICESIQRDCAWACERFGVQLFQV